MPLLTLITPCYRKVRFDHTKRNPGIHKVSSTMSARMGDPADCTLWSYNQGTLLSNRLNSLGEFSTFLLAAEKQLRR